MNKDVISGIALLALSAGYFWAASRIPQSMLDDEFGARGLPNVLATLLAVLAVIIAVRGFVASRRPVVAEAEAIREGDHEATLGRAAGLLLIGAGYVVVLPILGYPVSLALMIATIALYEGAGRTWRVPAAAIFGGLLFWLIFNVLLGVDQPAGVLF